MPLAIAVPFLSSPAGIALVTFALIAYSVNAANIIYETNDPPRTSLKWNPFFGTPSNNSAGGGNQGDPNKNDKEDEQVAQNPEQPEEFVPDQYPAPHPGLNHFKGTGALLIAGISNAQDAYADAPKLASPIILDLDGDGVETTNPEQSGVFFDHDADGFAEMSAWVAGNDGLLFLDRNSNEGMKTNFLKAA